MLPTNNVTPTMTSTQLSGLLGIEKKEVNRKIKDMFSSEIHGGEITPSLDARGYVVEYHLNELQSTMFVARWHLPFLMQISQYWIDRKSNAQQLPQLPQTFAEALQLAADQAKQLELAAPKVAFVDKYVESTGLKTFREVCKMLGANERKFRAMLVADDVMYLLNGGWTVKAYYLAQDYFKVNTGEKNGHSFSTVKFTARGVEWVSRKWSKFVEVK